MEFWRSVWSWFNGSTQRNVGVQVAGPQTYEEPAAVSVTEDTAMQISAVWACVRLLSETVASLPVAVYRKTPEGRVRDDEFWFYKLMSRKPNRYQTRVEFFETLMLNLALHGNSYCKVSRVQGEIKSLMPLMSGQVEPSLMDDGSIVYRYQSDGGMEVYSEQSIWHVKLYGNGIIGKSPLAFGRNMVGIAQAAEKATTKVYQNGGKRSGVLSLDRLLTPEQRDAVRSNFSTLTTGTSERLLVLENGMKFDPISMSPQDIELLSSRKFQIEEICRWFGVPSVLVNDTSGSTSWGSGIEQLVSGFYKLNLRPYLERIENSISCNLFSPEEAAEYEFEFDFEGLLRSDFKSRLEAYRTAVAGTIMTPNEVRKLEGLPVVDGGDMLLSQVNMAPIDQLGTQNSVQGVPNATQTN
jgi:HK97 family phage portal protein